MFSLGLHGFPWDTSSHSLKTCMFGYFTLPVGMSVCGCFFLHVSSVTYQGFFPVKAGISNIYTSGSDVCC